MARTKLLIWSAVGLAAAAAVVTSPIWGMGPAVFLDSDRTMLSRALSPDGTHIAQTERLVVGGAPSIVVTVRPAWMPNWYLLGCAAAAHYGETSARLQWVSNRSLAVAPAAAAAPFWRTDGAPFHKSGCAAFAVTITRVPAPHP